MGQTISVEALVFWLMPVLLLTIFIIVIVDHGRDSKRHRLYFIEPLGTLIRRWRPVRLLGSSRELEKMLAVLASAKLDDNSALEHLLRLESDRPAAAPVLAERRRLDSWTDQVIVREGAQTRSLIVGNPTAVLAAARYRADGRTLLTDSDRAEIATTALRAAEHGYVAMALASRYFQTRSTEPEKHTWLGLAFLEPIIDEAQLARVRQLLPRRVKWVSVLPEGFLRFLNAKIRRTDEFAGVPRSKRTDSPQSREEYWEAAECLGEVGFDERYALIRYFESRRDCRLVSALGEDQSLPIRITTSV